MTRAEVLAARERAVFGGCCDRFADNMACDCLENAEDSVAVDMPACEPTGRRRVLIMSADELRMLRSMGLAPR